MDDSCFANSGRATFSIETAPAIVDFEFASNVELVSRRNNQRVDTDMHTVPFIRRSLTRRHFSKQLCKVSLPGESHSTVSHHSLLDATRHITNITNKYVFLLVGCVSVRKCRERALG